VRGLLHPAADEEFAEAVRYYAEIESDLGMRFYREMERLIRDACAHPERFRMFDPPARRRFGAEFPYAVIYVAKPDHVWIVAVMHIKRQPGYWRERLG
jgi:plasmid stabilization system protein ParE